MKNLLSATLLTFVGTLPLQVAGAATTGDWVNDNCAGCHALDREAYEALPVQSRAQRKGPPLFYAGNKFRQEWLVTWLQSPERIRPAGDYPPGNTETIDGKDLIVASSLAIHPALDEGRAREVADYLMTLKTHDDLVAAQTYEPGNIAWRLGQMNFAKFNNCIACHQDEPGYGGLSGPELYSAWNRLQPSFIASYIANPVAWDPHTLMPGGELNEDAVAKLANYLKAVSEEDLQ